MSSPLLTVKQVAARLGVSKRNAYALLSEGGSLAHLKIKISHKVVRVDANKLEEFLRDANS